jgi:hypothetical protein
MNNSNNMGFADKVPLALQNNPWLIEKVNGS